MKIEGFFAEGCASVGELRRRIEQAVGEIGIKAEAHFLQVSHGDAQRLGIGGSPTIWVNGRGIEEDARAAGTG